MTAPKGTHSVVFDHAGCEHAEEFNSDPGHLQPDPDVDM